MLHLAGAPYKNELIQLESVKDHRSGYPFGHVPVLVETQADGKTFELGEALAIEVECRKRLIRSEPWNGL